MAFRVFSSIAPPSGGTYSRRSGWEAGKRRWKGARSRGHLLVGGRLGHVFLAPFPAKHGLHDDRPRFFVEKLGFFGRASSNAAVTPERWQGSGLASTCGCLGSATGSSGAAHSTAATSATKAAIARRSSFSCATGASSSIASGPSPGSAKPSIASESSAPCTSLSPSRRVRLAPPQSPQRVHPRPESHPSRLRPGPGRSLRPARPLPSLGTWPRPCVPKSAPPSRPARP